MKKTIALLALTLIATPAFAVMRGAWTASADNSDRLQFNLSTRPHNNLGENIAISDIPGLDRAALRATVQTPVAFELRREAGNIAFEGTFKDGIGAGQFTFTPNPGYVSTLRTLGVNFEDNDQGDDDFLAMAIEDVSTAFIRSMQAEGYRETADTYLAMRIFKVTPELVRELRSLGYDKTDADDLIATRIHKVTPDYIRAMRAAGYANLSLDDLVASRIHKATPEFLAEMRSLGYGNISFDDLIAFRIHGVTADFIRELKAAGYENVPAEKLIEMRIQGIDAKFIKKMNGVK